MPNYISELNLDGVNSRLIKDKNGYLYFTCTTGRGTAAKVVSADNFSLITGIEVMIKFTSEASSDPASGNITLNINSTGDKEIIDTEGNTITYTSGSEFCNGKFRKFKYTGTKWILLNKTPSGGGTDIYVDGTTLYLPTNASVANKTLILG